MMVAVMIVTKDTAKNMQVRIFANGREIGKACRDHTRNNHGPYHLIPKKPKTLSPETIL